MVEGRGATFALGSAEDNVERAQATVYLPTGCVIPAGLADEALTGNPEVVESTDQDELEAGGKECQSMGGEASPEGARC